MGDDSYSNMSSNAGDAEECYEEETECGTQLTAGDSNKEACLEDHHNVSLEYGKALMGNRL